MAVKNVDPELLHETPYRETPANGVDGCRRKQREPAVDACAFRVVADVASQECLIARRVHARPQIVDDSRDSSSNESGHEMKDTDGRAQVISTGDGGATASGRMRTGATFAWSAAMRCAFRPAVRIRIGNVPTIQNIAMPSYG